MESQHEDQAHSQPLNSDHFDISGADLEAGVQFLHMAGFDPLTMAPIDNSRAAPQSLDIKKAIKAMGADIANRMAAIDRRLTSLESQSAGSHVEDHPVDASTPAPEAQKNSGLTSPPTKQSLSWIDRPVDEVPNYSAQIIWDDEDNNSQTNSKLFAVSEGYGQTASGFLF